MVGGMTPLAHEIVKDSIQPVARRTCGTLMPALKLLDGVHFFEGSAVLEIAQNLAMDLGRRPEARDKLAFLPAPRTWLEIHCGQAGRIGLLIEEESDNSARVTMVTSKSRGGELPTFHIPLRGNPAMGGYQPGPTMPATVRESFGRMASALYGFLAVINSPRVIMRRQHMPHRGLERRLVAQRGNVGKWPLQGWSELVLKVRPPEIDDEDHEAHLTGARALHFCRAHIRIRLGRLELVSSHWRGDPALGIKQTRYRLAA
jgi:hypothetical protein